MIASVLQKYIRDSGARGFEAVRTESDLKALLRVLMQPAGTAARTNTGKWRRPKPPPFLDSLNPDVGGGHVVTRRSQALV